MLCQILQSNASQFLKFMQMNLMGNFFRAFLCPFASCRRSNLFSLSTDWVDIKMIQFKENCLEIICHCEEQKSHHNSSCLSVYVISWGELKIFHHFNVKWQWHFSALCEKKVVSIYASSIWVPWNVDFSWDQVLEWSNMELIFVNILYPELLSGVSKELLNWIL